LFEDFFSWKANALPGRARERDIQLRDQRRHRSQLIVGAQVNGLCLFYVIYYFNQTLF
jgi:hypothetical protein